MMKKNKISALLAAVALSISCVGVYVTEDYDRQAPFDTYKSFNWMPKPEKMPEGARSALEKNPLLAKRIQEISEKILEQKGMHLASDHPDLLVNFYVGFNDRVDIDGWGYWYGPYWGYFWPHLGPYNAYHYTEGTLVMDFVDAKTKEMVWRGVADKALNYDYYMSGVNRNFSDSDLQEILTKMLGQFPPRRTASPGKS
jgi:Domain of unknown function (DUF4136)